jgi:PAS domain S-box-containing protein
MVAQEEQRRLRGALEMRGEKLRRYLELFDFAPLPLLNLNNAGLIETLNLSMASLLGRQRASLEGRPLIHFVDPDSRHAMLEHIRNCRRTEYSVRTEIQLLTEHGQNPIPVEIHSHSLPGDQGAFVSTLIDLRDRNRVEEERRRVEAAESVSQAKDIIQAHGGIMNAQSAGPDRGSIFSVILPALP